MTTLTLLERTAPLAYLLGAIASSAALGLSIGQEKLPIPAAPAVAIERETEAMAPTVSARTVEPAAIVEAEPIIEEARGDSIAPPVVDARRVRRPPSRPSKTETSAPSTPAPSKSTPAVDPLVEVVRGLERRGLMLTDLDVLPTVKLELERLQSGRSVSTAELWSALDDAELPTPLLRRKLDAVRGLLTERGRGLGPDVSSQLEQSYLHLETELASGPSRAGRHRLAADIRTLRVRLIR
jgi:hypothetical protein